MADVVALALALALGLLVGLGVGAVRGFQIAVRRRAVAGVNARIARFMPTSLPKRSAADIIAGRIRVVLGGQMFVLPVLPRAATHRWLEEMDASWAALGTALEEASDNTPEVLALLVSQQDRLLGMLRSYDQSNVLPPPEFVDEFATDAEVFLAAIEVWRAANPLAASLAEMTATTDGISPEAPSTSLPSMAGAPTTSTSA